MKKLLISFLVIISFIFISNSVFAGRKAEHLYILLENIPEDSYYVDILVKEDPEYKHYISEDKPTYDLNENSEIINYKDSDGYVSLTFNYSHEYVLDDLSIYCRITPNDQPSDEIIERFKLKDYNDYSKECVYNSDDYNLLKSNLEPAKYELYFSLNLRHGEINKYNINKEFDKFKIAIIDKDGNILKTSNETKLKSIEEYTYKYDGQKLSKQSRKSNDGWAILLVLAIILGVFGLFSFGTFVLFVLNIILYINKKDYPNYKFDGEYTPISIVLLTIILSVTGIIFLPFAFNLHVFIKLSSLKPKEEILSVIQK